MFLIVGGNSEIGSATARRIRARGGEAVSTTRRLPASANEVRLDFRAPMEDFVIPDGIRCACVFVAVARLAACDADPVGSAYINVKQTIALTDRLSARGIYTLFLSTNQVFDGDRPHVPVDAPVSPISEYGRQKAETEGLLLVRIASGAPVGVLRLAKVVSPGMALIVKWRQELTVGRSIHAFHDMMMAPTPVEMVAAVIDRMMEDRLPVIAQLTGPRDVTYAEVGRFLAKKLGVDQKLVQPVSAFEDGMPNGSTPCNTTLDSSYIAARYGVTVPDAFNVIEEL